MLAISTDKVGHEAKIKTMFSKRSERQYLSNRIC